MTFNSNTQKLTCEYCDKTVSMDETETLKTEKTEDFKIYKCPSCGAEVLTEEYTAATFCSFCQSPTLIEDKLSGEIAPSRIIPFKYNKEKAKEVYRKWTKSGHFVPSEFSRESVIDKITGIYVPFWLYDYDTMSIVDVEATRVRSERRGNTQYTHTDYFKVYRKVQAEFDKVPADASKQMEDEVMDKMEPFSYDELKSFDMSYLSGFYAERYNYTSAEMKPRIESRMHKYAKDTVLSTIKGYSSKRILFENYGLRGKNAEYVLLPVWILQFRYRGEVFKFSMNGQTGKIVAQLPMSKGKIAASFFVLTALIFTALHIIFMFV